jgi:hypothetical protein
MVAATEGGDQHPPGTPLDHGGQHPLGQVDDRGHVDGDQLQVVLKGDVAGEVAVDADPGVEGHRVQRPVEPGHRQPEPLHLVVGRQVGPDRLDLGAVADQGRLGRRQLVVLGGDDDVEVVLDELAGQLQPDPAGGAGDKCQRPVDAEVRFLVCLHLVNHLRVECCRDNER